MILGDNRNVWIDYLRSFLTVLVVAHHSTLAYTTFASFDKDAYINSTHPIVDTRRWIGLDFFENFNDVFFMSLMFLIGGLFLSKSIAKKGAINFIIDRAYRLLIPFIFLGTFFMLVAHFPAYYVAHNRTGIIPFVKDFFTTEKWPVGPPWFIWVLFMFNVLLVFINPIMRKLKRRIDLLADYLANRSIQLFFILLIVSWVVYVPIAHKVGAGTWTGWGPFDFQLSRILLYFAYFLIGVIIGNTDFNNKIFSQNSTIISKWWLWALLSLVLYSVLIVGAKQLEQMVKQNKLKEFNGWMIYYTLYVSSCVASCLTFITLFRRFCINKIGWWNSLSDNAYLIYLTHYIFVIWIQFLLMRYDISAFIKFLITFVSALTWSWLFSNLLRRINWVRQYL